jgi:hypothetical protein
MNRRLCCLPKCFFIMCCMVMAAASTQAQSIYKCGEGQKIYSDRPCVDGKPLPKTGAEPTELERAEAQKIAEVERKRANDLEKERLTQERAPKNNALGMDTRLRVTRSTPKSSSTPSQSKGMKFYTAPSASKPRR